MTGDANSGGDVKRFLGLLLMIAGMLWLVTTGLCTAVFASFVMDNYAPTAGDIQTMLIVAVPSAAIGWGIYAFGRYLRRGII